jgi:hypothetical protein
MRRFLIAFVVVASAACTRGPAASAPTPLATPADSVAVVGTLTRMFDALRTKDATAFRAEFHPAGRFTLLRPVPGGGDSVGVVVLPVAQFVQAVLGPTGSGVDEPIRNVRVTVDGALATAWAEYQVRTPTGVSNCGYDAFHLVKQSGGWKVLNVADSFRQSGCGPRWP